MFTLAIVVLIWATCGFVAWCACLADFYHLCTLYPELGSAAQQWEAQGRRNALGIAALGAFCGPIGLLAAIVCSDFFRHGFRVW